MEPKSLLHTKLEVGVHASFTCDYDLHSHLRIILDYNHVYVASSLNAECTFFQKYVYNYTRCFRNWQMLSFMHTVFAH